MSSETQAGTEDGAEVGHQGHGEEEALLIVSISPVELSLSSSYVYHIYLAQRLDWDVFPLQNNPK